MRYNLSIRQDNNGASDYILNPLDYNDSQIHLSEAMRVLTIIDPKHPLASYKTRAWTKLNDGDVVDIPNVDTGIIFRGKKVRVSDRFIHWNTHHIIHYKIRIINGEFKAVGYFVGAKKCRRMIVRSLNRLFHAARTRGHKIVLTDEHSFYKFITTGRNAGIDWWSQGDNMDYQYEQSLLVLKPLIDKMYTEQLNWRKK